MGSRYCCIIFVKIGKYHLSKSPILKLSARTAHDWTHARNFYIAYNALHKISFWMSGRSFLYDLWFSQTLRHKNGISIYMYIHLKKCSGKCKFQCIISQLVNVYLIWNFEDSLVEHQSYYKQNFKFLTVQEPSFLIPQTCPKSAVNWVLYVYRHGKFRLLYMYIWLPSYKKQCLRRVWSPL